MATIALQYLYLIFKFSNVMKLGKKPFAKDVKRTRYLISETIKSLTKLKYSFPEIDNIFGNEHNICSKVLHKLKLMANKDDLFMHSRIPNWLFNRNVSYPTPMREDKMIDHLESIDSSYKAYKLHDVDPIQREDVYAVDKSQVERFCKFKDIDKNNINFDVYLHVAENLLSDFKICEVIQEDDAIMKMDTSTSSCYPDYCKKYTDKAQDNAKQFIQQLEENIYNGNFHDAVKLLLHYPTTVFHRFQTKLKKTRRGNVYKDVKIRQVWGSPFGVFLLESKLFRLTIDEITKCPFFSYGLTRPEISSQVQQLRMKAIDKNRPIICGDIKSIDSDHPPFSILLLFALLMRFTDMNEYEEELCYGLLIYQLFTPVTWSSRYIAYTHGGNKSGSLFTSIINSVYMLTIIGYYHYMKYGRLITRSEVYILGDDFIYVGDEEDKENLIKYYRLFGLTLSDNKTHVVLPSEDITYLGFDWDISGKPDNPDLWWIAKVCFPERFTYDKGLDRLFNRFCSVVFQLKRSNELFQKVMVGIWAKYYQHHTKDIVIKFTSPTGFVKLGKIPLFKLISLGWKTF